MTDRVTDSLFAPHPQRHQQQVQAQEFSVDPTNLLTGYVNFARLTGTPEELVLDVGLNIQMTPSLAEPIKLTHRLVVDYYTAKRLLGALSWAVQQHESVYGVLETDIKKRACLRLRPILRLLMSTRRTITSISSPTLTRSSGLSTL
jgi:hypothetical protein